MKEILTGEVLKRSIANEGNPAGLIRLMKRAWKGERLTLCFLGGSITQGCLSSTAKTCYAYLVYDWFVKTFPKSRIRYVNAGIGGTTSQFGVTRLSENVFKYKPDFCMVEFSVNDNANVFFKETYEATLRKLLYSETEPALMILNNVFYENGTNAQKEHNELAQAYCIPALSVKDALYPEIEAGRLIRKDITQDNLHPNDLGHSLLAGIVTNYLEKIFKMYVKDTDFEDETAVDTGATGLEITGENKIRKLAPVTVNAMENLKRIQNRSKRVKLNGFTGDSAVKKNLRDIFKHGWYSRKQGDSLSLTFYGSELAVQYRKTVNKPAPVAVAVLDGDEAHPFILDANFKETWGDCLHIDTLLYHGEKTDPANIAENLDLKELERLAGVVPKRQKHTLKITVTETHKDEKSDFYLVSVLVG